MRRAPPVIGGGLLLATLIAAGVGAQSPEAERYDADTAASRLTVEGTSTVHDWNVEGRLIQGSLVVHERELSSLWTTGGSVLPVLRPTVHVEVPVALLRSGKRGMDEKMHEALKAQTHPVITYHLEAAEVRTRQAAQKEDSGESLTIETRGVLMVAGAKRMVNIPMQVRRLSENRLEISGDTSLRMTEFGIDPPTAMLGMLRTGDTVHVRWTWVLVRHRQTDDEAHEVHGP